MTTDVIIAIEGKVGRVSLNRPAALHALTLDMCQAMLAALAAWRDEPAVEAVMIDHAASRGFCAGGDIRAVAQQGSTLGRPFFAAEYRLNLALFDFPKPVIAVMDGVVMGGGAGLALPASIRIATENTLFAMPETGIGLIPDVGGGWHLPRLAGEAGTWLGLTGARLKAADCRAIGVATHTIDSRRLDAIKAALIADPSQGLRRLDETDWLVAKSTLPLPRINVLFAYDSVEAILTALEYEDTDWARAQRAVLLSRCPTSLKATLRQLRLGRSMTRFEQALALEYRLCTRLVDRPDFREGVRAAVIDKDQAPVWSPATLDGVDELEALFAPLPAEEGWRA